MLIMWNIFFRDILTLVLEKYILISEALAKLVKFITPGKKLVQSEKLPRNVDVTILKKNHLSM